MKLSQVVETLDRVIEQKKSYLQEQKTALQMATFPEETAIRATVDFVTLNVEELQRIATDLKNVTEL